jgi:PAS domain S-box-containing protein
MIQKKLTLFRPLFYFLLVVLVFLVLIDFLFLMKQYSVLIGSEKKNMQEELELMGTLMREALLKNDYATVENFVQSWGETHENVTEIRAVAKNNFPISEFRRKTEDHEIVSISHKVEYSEGRFITLHLSKSLRSIQERFRNLILSLGALSLGLTMLMAALLWFTIKKTAIRPMQGMLEEINSLNEELEQRVAERTEALRRTNQELETEISERREAEEEIRIKANLLESSSDAILLLDLDANFIYFNSALMRMTGYTREELLERKLADIEPPDFAERIKPDIDMLITRGEAVYESAFLSKDSSIVPVEVHALLTESSGRKVIMCAVRDISERKQAEKDREKLEARISSSPRKWKRWGVWPGA